MPVKEFFAATPKDLDAIAPELLSFLAKAPSVWLLNGQMGAGKTTLSAALGRALKINDVVQSPTFGLINEYRTNSNTPIYHFDFYRLKDEYEAMAIGVEEYLASGELCWLEWAERIEGLLPDKYVTVNIDILPDKQRKIEVHYNE